MFFFFFLVLCVLCCVTLWCNAVFDHVPVCFQEKGGRPQYLICQWDVPRSPSYRLFCFQGNYNAVCELFFKGEPKCFFMDSAEEKHNREQQMLVQHLWRRMNKAKNCLFHFCRFFNSCVHKQVSDYIVYCGGVIILNVNTSIWHHNVLYLSSVYFLTQTILLFTDFTDLFSQSLHLIILLIATQS